MRPSESFNRALRRLVVLLALSVLIASCASSGPPFHEVAPKEKDGAIVYVYRLSSIVGAAVSWAVRLDDVKVASIRSGTYTVVYTTPGIHTLLIADSPLLVGLILDPLLKEAGAFKAEANGVYFVRCAGFKFPQFVSREEAMKEIVHMSFDPSP
jgi:hypothetical protein